MNMHSEPSPRLISKGILTHVIPLLMMFVLVILAFPQKVLADTSWFHFGWDSRDTKWSPGNIINYNEGDNVPFRVEAVDFDRTSPITMIEVDHKYEISQGANSAIGYDGIQPLSWFIGPITPTDGGTQFPELHTFEQIKAYCIAKGLPLPIKPSATTFTYAFVAELTTGGDPITGKTGPSMLRYSVTINPLIYTALETNWGGDFAIYYEAHLAQTGQPFLFDPSRTVYIGAGGYPGSSLQARLTIGDKTVPLPTNQLSDQDLEVEKIWVNPADAVPVTIELWAKNGTGTPYLVRTITLNGVIDTPTPLPEYEPWKGRFVDVPLYYYISKVPHPITYYVVENPVPSGFKPPVYNVIGGTYFTVKNEINTGDLTIRKTFIVPDGYTTDEIFTFTIIGPSGTFTETLTQASPAVTIPNLLPGAYTVTEAAVDGWSFSLTPLDGIVTVNSGETGVAVVLAENTKLLGDLTIMKTFVVPAGYTTGQAFTFTITGPSGTFTRELTMASPSVTIPNLLPGDYLVVETPVDGWGTNLSPTGVTVSVVGGQTGVAKVLAQNTKLLVDLTIEKTFDVPAGYTTDESFNFIITGPSGSFTVALSMDNLSATITGLLPGEYLVEESPSGGWISDLPPSGMQINIASGGTGTATIYAKNTKLLGDLTIEKTFVVPASYTTDQSFTFTISGPSGTFARELTMASPSVTLPNLLPGDYLVVETPVDGWSSNLPPAGVTVSVVGGETGVTKVLAQNTKLLGDLTIEKTFVVPEGYTTNQTFTFTITGPSGTFTRDLTQASPKVTLPNLLPGDYLVVESPVNGWSSNLPAAGININVVGGKIGVAKIYPENTKLLGDLTIEKTFVVPEGYLTDQVFTFTITGPSGTFTKNLTQASPKVTIPNLLPGDYLVVESPVDGWSSNLPAAGININVVGGKIGVAKIYPENTKLLGDLTIEKTFVVPEGYTTDQIFTFTITGPSGPFTRELTMASPSVTIPNLLPGEYTVSEAAVDGWTFILNPADGIVNVVGGETGVAKVVAENTKLLGDLTIEKTFVVPEGYLTDQVFTFTIVGPSGTIIETLTQASPSVTIPNLLPGKYTVSEAPVDGWTFVLNPADGIVNVVGGETGVAKVLAENTKLLGDLTIEKTFVVPEGYTTDQIFTFTVVGPSGTFIETLTQASPSVTIPNLLPGKYTVSEAPVDGWTFILNPADGIVNVVGGETGKAKVSAENRLLLGSLKVTKTFDFNDFPGDKFYPDSIQVRITGPSYLTGDVKTLTGTGWTAEWTGLLPGNYTVHFFNELPANGPWTLPADQTIYVGGGQAKSVTGTDVLRYETNTAWGFYMIDKSLNKDFLTLKTGNQNWGWSFGPVSDGTYTLDMLAGCGITGTNKTIRSYWENGDDVGDAVITVSGSTVTVTITMSSGNFIQTAHVWAGATELPVKNVKKQTLDNSPGSFPGVGVVSDDGKSTTITLTGVTRTADGKVFIAVHTSVLSLIYGE